MIYKLGLSQAKCKGVLPSEFFNSSPALKLKLLSASILKASSWSFSADTWAAVFKAE